MGNCLKVNNTDSITPDQYRRIIHIVNIELNYTIDNDAVDQIVTRHHIEQPNRSIRLTMRDKATMFIQNYESGNMVLRNYEYYAASTHYKNKTRTTFIANSGTVYLRNKPVNFHNTYNTDRRSLMVAVV